MNRLLIHIFLVSSICLFVSSCNSNDGSIIEQSISKKNGIVVPVLDNYQVVLPQYFIEMPDINPHASLQYGFTSKEKDSSKAGYGDEIYVTILVLPKNKLASTFSDTGRITLNKVNSRTAINLEHILAGFEVVENNPKPILINGLAAIRNEFRGQLGDYNVFYKMAIYESESEYYQLLTWCMQKYAKQHSDEMDGIIESFENV